MPESDNRSTLPASKEPVFAALILLVFLIVSLAVCARTPTVYVDEPIFTDPAANLFYGQGFTSAMWGEDRHQFWCNQPPLYSSLLYVSFKCFGFGLFQARMTNVFLTTAAAWLIWSALRRSKLVATPRGRLLSVALILSGSVSVMTFRMIRYDVAMFLVSALVFFTCCLSANFRSRYLWAILASTLFPFAGMPMLPFVCLLLFFQLLVYRFRNIGLLLSVGTGLTLGVALLLLFYKHFGVLDNFFNFLSYSTNVDSAQRASRTLKSLIFGESLGGENIFTSFFGNPLSFLSMQTLFDYSAFLLFLVAAFITAKLWRTLDDPNRRLMAFLLMTSLLLPPAIHAAAHYWSYYRWMSYMPLAIFVPRLLELAQASNSWRVVRRVAPGIISLSLFLGLPLRTAVIFPDWSARSVKPLEQVAAKVVQPADVVVCGFKSFFAVRGHAQLVFCYGLTAKGAFNLIKDFPTNQVTLLCLPAKNVTNVIQTIGGKWIKVPLDADPDAAALSRTRYAVDFYRRNTN